MAKSYRIFLLLAATAVARPQEVVNQLSNDLFWQCLTPFWPAIYPGTHIVVPEPSEEDAHKAAEKVKADPFFTIVEIFGGKDTPGVERDVPVEFEHGTALIHIEAKDLSNTFNFSLATVYPAIEAIITGCISEREPGSRQGGYAEFPASKDFYVMVQAKPAGRSYVTLNYGGEGAVGLPIAPRLAVNEQGVLADLSSVRRELNLDLHQGQV